MATQFLSGLNVTSISADEHGSNIVQHKITINTTESIWTYSLSPDGKYIAFVSYPSAKVVTIDLATGLMTEFESINIRNINSIFWSQQGKKFAISNNSTICVVDFNNEKANIDIFGVLKHFIKPPLSFYRDTDDILLASLDEKSNVIVDKISNIDRNPVPALHLPNIFDGKRTFIKGSSFQNAINQTLFNYFVSDLDSINNNIVVSKQNGKTVPDVYAVSNFVGSGDLAFNPLQLEVDIISGIDKSGVMRQSPSKMAHSMPTGLWIVFRESGTIISGSDHDFKKDKSFEVYRPDGVRVSAFGGYGTVEGNQINGFDVHPSQPWVVTSASLVSSTSGYRAGMLTIWDVNTGVAIQRIATPKGLRNPIFSNSGTLITAACDDGFAIFNVK